MDLVPVYRDYVRAELEADTAWLEKLEQGAASPSPKEQALAEQHADLVRERIRRWHAILAAPKPASARRVRGRSS